MRILRIYSLENKGLSQEECAKIKKHTNTDVLIHLTANNQLDHIQYPIFEFDEIEWKTENVLKAEISQEQLKNIIENQSDYR